MCMNPLVEKARMFAYEAHREQRYGSEPYHVHLEEVVANLQTVTDDPEVLAAGYLHDTIEDVPTVTTDTLHAMFGSRVAELVWAVTGIGKNRKERVANALAKLAVTPDAVTIKLADRLANARRSLANSPDKYRMYQKEHGAFRDHLAGRGDPRLWAALDEVFPTNV